MPLLMSRAQAGPRMIILTPTRSAIWPVLDPASPCLCDRSEIAPFFACCRQLRVSRLSPILVEANVPLRADAAIGLFVLSELRQHALELRHMLSAQTFAPRRSATN